MIKPKYKRSIVWGIDKTVLLNLAKNATSISYIVKSVGLKPKGGNSRTVKECLNYHGIDYSHIPLGRNSNKVLYRGGSKPHDVTSILQADSSFTRSTVRRRVLEDNLISYVCAICNFDPILTKWRNQTLVLVLDHINGISNDHRLINLRFLCPNCNSQTLTFAGRRKKYF